MNEFLNMVTQPAALLIIGGVALVCAVFLLTMWRRQVRLAAKLESARIDAEKVHEEYLSTKEAERDDQMAQYREELATNLRGMSDSITRAMGEMARIQQMQLDAFSGQLRDIPLRGVESPDREKEMLETEVVAYQTRIRKIESILQEKNDTEQERFERLGGDIVSKVEDLLKDSSERMQKTVDQRLNDSLDHHLGESFQQMSERLEQVYKGLDEMQSLASGMGDLKRVLTGVRARGLLGEVQLSTLLSQIMAGDQYIRDKVIKEGGERVNFAVRLPGSTSSEPASFLPIDARFPQEVYIRLMDAIEQGNPAQVEMAAADMEAELISAAVRLQEQFVDPPNTTDFAVLFLPSEGMYAEVLRRPNLSERLQRDYHVMLTGPSTLAALLNSLQMGFKTLAIERHSEEVWALLGAVRGEFVNFADSLLRTQKRIRQASEAIEDATRKSRTIQRKLKGVESLDAIRRRELFGEGTPEDEDPFAADTDSDDWD